MKKVSKLPPMKPIKPSKIQDARRILSRVLYWLQTGEIDEATAKTICYVSKTYTDISVSSNLEKDVEFLMNKQKERNTNEQTEND